MYRSILARNKGRGAWDASRGALSTYVYVVCRSVESHILEAGRAKDRGPQLGEGSDASLSYRAKATQVPGRSDLAAVAYELAADSYVPVDVVERVLVRVLGGEDAWAP